MEFDYNKAVRDAEALIRKVEDPSTGVEEAEKTVAKASALLEQCYAYLRSERDSVEKENEN